MNIVDFDSPIAIRELPGVDVLPYVRLVSPEGKVVLEESGPVDELLGKVRKAISSSKRAPVFSCPMHPEVREPAAGDCPKCGMSLESKSE